MNGASCALSSKPLLAEGAIVSLSGGNIFVGLEQGSWVSLNRTAVNLVNQLDGNTSVAELVAVYDFDSVKECLLKLWSVGLLEIDGRGVEKKKDYRPNSAPYYALLNVTRDCNMQCTYCYSPRSRSGRISMSIEIARIVISKMLELTSTRPLIVVFHGGEPLLEFRNIIEIIDSAKNMAKRKKRKIGFQLQTNGTLLTEEVADFLNREKVATGISLDGHKEGYNLCRTYKDGKGAFPDILRGLEVLQRYNIDCGVIGVINKYNVNHLDDIFKFLVNKGITKMNFIPVHPQNNRERFSEGIGITSDQLYEGTVKLIEEMIKFNRQSEVNAFVSSIVSIVLNSINQEPYSMCRQPPCGAGTEMLVFDVNGDVYPCDNFSGVTLFNCGNIVYDGISTILKSHGMREFRTRVVDSVEECSACEWNRICCGGRISSTCSLYEDSFYSTQYCSYYKRIIPYIINLFLGGVDPSLLLPSSEAKSIISSSGDKSYE